MGKQMSDLFSKDGERVEKEHYCLQGHQASSTCPCDR